MLFKRRNPVQSKPSVAAATAVYAIGDVHGRLDLLQLLMGRIVEDAALLETGVRPVLVFLGDYIDRGPESSGVIDEVLGLVASGQFEVRQLKGNHEQALLSFLDDVSVGPVWASFGGLATIQSYLGRTSISGSDLKAWDAVRESLREAIPERHLEFYRSLEPYYVSGDYCFVHAGLKPGVPLEEQREMDLISIRAEFLNSRQPFEKFIVYGHTPNLEPVIEPHRIGIDTGAFATGVLSCLRVVGADALLLQARI
jgi:serine/threonine protein phosphatase 1